MELFKLKKWDTDYFDDLMNDMKDRELISCLCEDYPYPFLASHARYFIEQRMFNSEEKQCCRAVEIDGHAVGSVEVIIGSGIHSKKAEIHIWISKEKRGNGIGTEAVREMCRFAFENYDIVRIEARIYINENVSISEKMFRSAGFKYEGTVRNAIFKEGKLYSYKIFSILNTEYENDS